MSKHFCNCTDLECELNPHNHDRGCDLCIKKNLTKGEIPTCFFLKVSPEIKGVTSFKIKDFVDFYHSKTNGQSNTQNQSL